MRYHLVYTERAAKDVRRLESKMRERIGKALLRFQTDPHQYAEKLAQSQLGSFRFRIGDYRVVFDIEGSQIVVLRVGHRREIYKRG